MLRRFLGLLAFVATGGGLLLDTLSKTNPNMSIVVAVVVCFFAFGIIGHYKELGK